MNVLVVYASQYGNTRKIAETIANAFTSPNKVRLVEVSKASVEDLSEIDLFIAGSPTQGGRPTAAFQRFLDSLPSSALKNVKVASFDTRFLENNLNFALKLLVKTIGYASPKIAKTLENKGGILITPPEAFIIKGKAGPLEERQLDRAKKFAENLSKVSDFKKI